MMTRRLTVLAVLIVVVLTLGVGAVLAAPPRGDTDPDWHDRMHTSEQMRGMHEQMPDEAQADCDRMHAQMGGMHARGGHMSGNGPTMTGGAMPGNAPSSP